MQIQYNDACYIKEIHAARKMQCVKCIVFANILESFLLDNSNYVCSILLFSDAEGLNARGQLQAAAYTAPNFNGEYV